MAARHRTLGATPEHTLQAISLDQAFSGFGARLKVSACSADRLATGQTPELLVRRLLYVLAWEEQSRVLMCWADVVVELVF